MRNWLLDIFKKARKENIERIDVYDKYISLNIQLQPYDRFIQVTTANKIFEGIDKDLPRVEVVDVYVKNQHILRIGYSAFLYPDTLKSTLDKLIAYEEYKLCYQINQYLETLKNKSEKYLVE